MGEEHMTLAAVQPDEVFDQYLTYVTQSPQELASLIALAKEHKVKSFLEIGSRFGGTLWRIAREMPAGSRVVSIDPDIGHGSGKPGAPQSLRACISHLCRLGYDAHHIDADSTDKATVAKAAALGPFDLIFIDGGHEAKYVRADWKNYGPMGWLVSFHDTHWKMPKGGTRPVDVPALWAEIKPKHKCVEFHDPAYNYGIGVVFR
jgi:cephalosporin hydroxylase